MLEAAPAAGFWTPSQPPWTLLTGGCHPNRDTEKSVENAGFCIERAHYRARGVMRHFVARRVE